MIRRKKRPEVRVGKLGIVRLSRRAMEALRTAVYERDGGRCVVCGKSLRLEAGYWDSMHLAHIVGRGAGGSDTPENTRSLCIGDHIAKEHNAGGQPCPRGEWRRA